MAKENKDNNWMQTLWRPMMGWMYMLICLLDMAIFPVLWSLLQAVSHQQITQWNPLTLQGAGLFHIAMGAVLGIAAFGRTQEKLAGTAANPTATSQTITQNGNMGGMNNGMGMNSGVGMSGGFGGGMSGGFGGNTGMSTGSFGGNTGSSFGSPTMSTPAPTLSTNTSAPTNSKSAVPMSFPPL